MILQSFITFVMAVGAGFLLAHLIWPKGQGWAVLLKLSLGVGLGLGITSCLYFLRMLLFPGQGGYLLIEGALFAFMLLIYLFKGRPAFNLALKLKPLSGWQLFFGLASFLVLGFTVYSSILYSRINPHGDYDAQAIWNLRARFMYRLGDEWRSAFSPDINRNFHMDYPLLVPMNVVGGWNTLHGEVLRIPAVHSLLFLIGLAGLTYSALALWRSSSQGSIAMIVLLVTPYILLFSTFQTADIPLSYFFLASLILLILALQENSKGLLFLSGLMAGLSAWTKNEGFSFVLVVAVFCLFFYLPGQRWQGFFSLLGGMALPLLTSLLFKTFLPSQNDLLAGSGLIQLGQRLSDPIRYNLILTYLKAELAILGGWPINILILLGAYCLILGWNPSARQQFNGWFLLIIAAQFTIYCLIYLITPNDVEWQLKYSLSRLLMQLFPMALLLFFLFIRTPENA